MRQRILLLIIVAFLFAASTASGQFNYEGKNYGIQVDLGLGFTKGIDAEEIFKEVLGKIDMSGGATMRFGVSGKFRVIQGLYLQPMFQASFFNGSIDLNGKQAQDNQGNVYNLKEYKWSNTHINFGVIPTYYFRFENSPIHPFGGLALKLHYYSMGDPDLEYEGGKEKIKDGGDSKFGFGMGFMGGAEFMVNDQVAIPLILQYDLIFPEYVCGVFLVTTGVTFYF